MGKKNNRKYSLDFKKQAVALALDIGYAEAGRQLGIPQGSIHGWKTRLEKNGELPMNKKLDKINLADENKRLQKENVELKKVNTILKAAAAFFSQDHLK